MIYRIPKLTEPIDQGDLINDCPVAAVTEFAITRPDQAKVVLDLQQAGGEQAHSFVRAIHFEGTLLHARVQLLMGFNREIYLRCPEVPTFADRLRALLHLRPA